ncbi:MAG: class I SAM-dependent methyltransferase [Planctomycetota bacterium]
MASHGTDEGYLTVATGHQRYVELAVNLALSIKHHDRRPVALLHDDRVTVPAAYRQYLDVVVEAKPECLLPGLDTKLLLQRYSPLERTMFVDADCLMAKRDVDRFWERLRDVPFTVIGDAVQRGRYHRFEDVGALTAKMGLPHMIRHNGGFMYFGKGETARRVFAQARSYYEEHRDFLSYPHTESSRGYNEEPFFAAAIALLGLKPLPPQEGLMSTAHKGPYAIDVLSGRCAYGEEPVLSPTVVHFARVDPLDVYARETTRLRHWFGLPPWVPPGADGVAASVEPLLRVPGKTDILPLLPRNAVVAEIGVFKGGFSRQILEATEPATLHLIDPWPEEVSSGGTVGKGDDVHQFVLQRFPREIGTGQVVVHRKASVEAAAEFDDACFDWVFLDANHGYKGMTQDLEAYYPKVKPGGYVTGHDYVDVKNYGVIQAVDEFVEAHPVRMVALSGDDYPSFVLRKDPTP